MKVLWLCQKSANFFFYSPYGNVNSAMMLASRVLRLWSCMGEFIQMTKPNTSAIGCSLEMCRGPTVSMTVVMACFYGEPEAQDDNTAIGILSAVTIKPTVVTTTTTATIPSTISSKNCNARKDEAFRNYTVEFHNRIRKANGLKPMNRSCELERMADDAVIGCPVSARFESDAMNYSRCKSKFFNGNVKDKGAKMAQWLTMSSIKS
ncbi:unnamed protein product [Angiostrongylus costaricensis]|uniref:SCP domain-containing protein n=1 Tax=Angiostrongylus costaricensis TaxID=334426 RepID=A0A0R3PS20_ANGCS|nr:unnamed protein product [Angiostrongylus costaricensis]